MTVVCDECIYASVMSVCEYSECIYARVMRVFECLCACVYE